MIRSPWGGSEELWASLALEALKEGHQVYHSALDCGKVHPKMQHLIDKGVSVSYRKKVIPPGTGKFKKLFILGYYFMVHRIQGAFHKVLKHHPDIVIYNGTSYSIAEDRRLLRELKGRNTRFFIITQCNLDTYRPFSDVEGQFINKAYAMAERVFFVSQRNLDTARRHLCNPILNAVLVRNPVNMVQPSPLPYPTGDTLQLALVGNLVTVHKGQDLAFAALSRPEWQQRNWRLNIYGDGQDEQYLKTLCTFYGLGGRVTFHGHVSDIRAIWAANHLLLMPSLMEGMPLAVVEAMLCARPCVATDVGGHEEWITDGQEGFIAEAASVNSIGHALERAWQAKDNWQAIGVVANRKAMSLYDPQPGKTLFNLLSDKAKQ